jgi:hypothetical protein
MNDSRWEFGLDIRSIDHFHTDSWVHSVIAPTLISTLYKSLVNTLSLFQPAVSSLVVARQRLLTVANRLLPGSSPLWTSAPIQLPLLQLTPRLAAISHQTPSLLFTVWLSSDKCHLTFLQTPVQNWLGCPSYLLYTSLARPGNTVHSRMLTVSAGMCFTEPFPSSGLLFMLIKNLMSSNGHRSVVCFAAVD